MYPSFTSRRPALGFLAACAALAMAAPSAAMAQDAYPNKPIRLLLGFPPGGGSDMVARLVAKPLGERLGQPVTVDNKPGAGGNIAAEMATKAPADGYTLILLPSGHASSAAMKKVLPFDPVNDFSWISTLTTYPLSMVVKPDSPIRSFPDFAQRIKAEPGKYTYTSVGVGTAMHLVGEWLMAESGGSATHVPFRGGTAPLTELLAGRVDVVIDTMTSTAPMLKDKRVRGLAVTGAKGEANIFGLPNVAETYPRLVFDSWLGIAAPPGLPPAIAARLQREIKAVIDSPEVRQRLIDWGGSPQASTPAEFKGRVERDIQALKRVVADRKIEME
ncbi:MAG: tripartite tricarboxylate transporter substrate binding protein [Comamonadaceae bacterium]|nr:tripartite tricarboxylate transporter substrate binding protein [Comamonadaceae bacterium]